MSDVDDDLLRIAADIADRTPVDWHAQKASGEGDASRLAGLKVVESVAMAYGSLMETTADGGEPAAGPPRAAAAEPALFEWGHLRALERLGGGSFGEVFRAYDPLLDREVALKLRRVQEVAAEAGRREFIREARLLARVRHPNVVVVHGADTHDGRVGLWTDLVNGRTLEEFLAEEGPMAPQSVALIGLDLCRALAAVHAAGLVHGDVKPANVMRERGGRIVLMDFGAGLEILEGRISGDAGGPRGTPLAMAPEVLHGGTPVPASDIYSLGALLYRLASGCHPIEAETLGELLERSRSTHITPLRDARPDVPPEFVAIIEHALAREPADRFPSAGAMEHALLRWIAPVGGRTAAIPLPQQPVSGTPAGAPAGRYVALLKRVPWRNRWLRSALALLALAAVAGAALIAAKGHRTLRPAQGQHVRSIAVLPFQALDPTSDDDVLGAGIADALITRLGRLSEIAVSPTSAVLPFAGTRPDPRSVGERLGVEGVLEGRIQRAAGRTRVTAQLVSTSGGAPIWTATFDQSATNIFELEDSIAEQLVRALRLKLSGPERADLVRRPTTSAEAYQAYLMGRNSWNKYTAASLRRSVESFGQAVRLDPGFALAYTGLAAAHSAMPGMEAGPVSPAAAYPRALAAAQRALDLEPELAEGHAALGIVRMRQAWDWAGAEREFRVALERDPACFTAHLGLAELHSILGEHEQAIAEVQGAIESDPLSLPANAMAGRVYQRAGRWQDADAQLRRALEIEPAFHLFYTCLAAGDEANGRFEDAASNWQNAMALSGTSPEEVSSFGRAFASGGMAAAWHWRLERLQGSAARGEYVPPALVARAHAALGDSRAAVSWLRKAAETHDEWLLWTIDDPAFAGLRTEAGFAAIRQAIRRRP